MVSVAHAQAPAGDRVALVESGLPDAPAWWGWGGRAGWLSDAWWGPGSPWTLAGHARGAWALDEPGPPAAAPFPGVFQAQSPLGWYDTLAVESGGRAAWDGFDGTLARAALGRRPLRVSDDGRRRALADLVLGSGSSAYDENGLWIRRGDSLSWVGGGALGWKRGGVGSLAAAGRHLYGFSGAWTRGRHRLEAAFAQRGTAGALTGGEEQSAAGASGSVGYALAYGKRALALTMGRAYDHHESHDAVLEFSRRDARERWALAEWRGDSAWAAHLVVRDAHVARQREFADEARWKGLSAWLALRATRRRGPVRLEGALGAGRHGGVQRNEVAPSVALVFAEGPVDARVHLERMLAPVWSDLASGQSAFLQRTWAGGFEIGAATPGGSRGRASWLMGRTRERAIVSRLPLEDLWLREGFRADGEAYDFGLASLSAEWRAPHLGLGGEGYALLHDRSPLQPNVDPARGGRAFGEIAFRAFRGDLGVTLRGELEAVGPRESEGAFPRALPGYVSFGGGGAFTLGDATVTLRFRDLEDRRRPQVWEDSLTGEPAVGPGREFRLTLAWRLFN